MYFIFPPHLTSASALPGEKENLEFHLGPKCCMLFHQKTQKQFKISPGQSWTTLHCQNDRLGAPDRT